MMVPPLSAPHDYTSPIHAATNQIDPTKQLLFPFMNFTCSGKLARLIFVARKTHHLQSPDRNQKVLTSWPVFSLWQNMSDTGEMEMQRLGPDSIASIQPANIGSMTNDSQEQVFMINFMPPIQFERGYFLGLRQYYSLNTSITQPNWYIIEVLRQRGGYGLKLTRFCGNALERPSRCWALDHAEYQEVPYIAVEISKRKRSWLV